MAAKKETREQTKEELEQSILKIKAELFDRNSEIAGLQEAINQRVPMIQGMMQQLNGLQVSLDEMERTKA